MKIEGYSYEIFKSISPQKVRLYLQSSGWQLERRDLRSDVFSNPNTGEVVDVPNDREFRDYAYRLEEIVRTISDSENKSVQRIITGMTITASSDTIEYHYYPKNNEIGLIPTNNMIKIIDSGNDLNNYAYRDFCEYRPAYPNSNWTGKKTLQDIRLGPTLPGSYIVQFVYPLMNGDEKSYGTTMNGELLINNVKLRDVCNKVETSLSAVVETAESGKKEMDPELKISYNFVSAMRGLEFDDADVEVRRIKVMDKNDSFSRPVALTSSIFRRISDIERNMRPEEMLNEQNFVGRIIEVKDPREEKDADKSADFKIHFIDTEGKYKTAYISLCREDLDLAYGASKDRKNVSISGKLVGAGRNKRIEDPTAFRVLS